MVQIIEKEVIRTTKIDTTHHILLEETVVSTEKFYIKTLSDLYQYGKFCFHQCIGKMYITQDPADLHIGYVFRCKRKFPDPKLNYIEEIWLSLERTRETVEYLPVKKK